ncbi:glycosyltransferase family 4 protein [Lutibacter sp.]|uniref:glycosyltransferase family 4 protein n=1 Tax=Lutibacter sp. TaxID=1925666 RepID=UPI00273527CE|nr:glycosyltransferase family 4 protein [Lutibacter sp.]MDP3312587.1 glycosyltransferase family 4 protein [Lutibacter sp.]
MKQKKIVLASGSRHTIPAISSSPGNARTITAFAENEGENYKYYVLSKYDVSLESLKFDRTKYLHPLPSAKNSIYEYFLNKLPYRIKKRIFGFTQADRIIYYYGIKKIIGKVKPDIIVTFMHFELYKILQKAFPDIKHIFFYLSTDIGGRLGQKKIKYIIENSDGFMANTQLAIKEFKEFDSADSLPTASVYNAVMLPKDSYNNLEEKIKSDYKVKFNIESKALIIGYAGRFSNEKSLLEILEAMLLLKNDGETVHLYIAGDINNERTPDFEYFNKVMSFIDKHLKEQVHFFGWVTYENLFNFYASIDIGILLSKYREGNSMFLIECLSVGKPVIATNIGGNIETLENNEIGFLIDNTDVVKSLYEKIKYLNLNRSVLNKLSKNAILYAKEHHSNEVMTTDFNRFIERFI